MSYANPRIKLEMSMMDMLMVMADGNPGAITVMMHIIEKSKIIDPDDILAPIGAILALDTHDIYGPRIWMFFKDVCKQNLNHMLGLLRAVQLGYLSDNNLSHAIDNYGDGLNIPTLIAQVKERLPAFVMDVEVKAA